MGDRSPGIPCPNNDNIAFIGEILSRAMVIQDVGLRPPEGEHPVWDRNMFIWHLERSILCLIQIDDEIDFHLTVYKVLVVEEGTLEMEMAGELTHR